MKGAILEKSENGFTFLKNIFLFIRNAQIEYNWLITAYECYPENKSYAEMLSKEYCWISGKQLTEMVNEENFQWIWGVLSAFPPNISLEEVLKYQLPEADGYSGFWKNPISIQHPLAEIELVAWDGSLTILISKKDTIIEEFQRNSPLSEDLEKYNKR